MGNKSIKEYVNGDLKIAMRMKDKNRLSALRSIKTAFMEAETAKGSNGELTKDKEYDIIKKLYKQRKDSEAIYRENGRLDLADKEKDEAQYIKTYLPNILTEEETDLAVTSAIVLTKAETIKDMGKVMGFLKKEFGARLDGGLASRLIKESLNK